MPITRLVFPQSDVSFGFYTLGRFECSGQLSVSGVPRSCFDLWIIGHTLSGIYLVMGAAQVETVYCDFTKLPHEQGKTETTIFELDKLNELIRTLYLKQVFKSGWETILNDNLKFILSQ